jgi:hypothetical protein
MTIRYTAGDPNGVSSGYSSPDVPDDLQIPGCGIQDVDRAIFDMFDKTLKLSVSDKSGGESKPVPAIFAPGERWALFKKERPFRDNNQTIILPLTTIRRTDIEQNITADITGRGINQQTGELVIKRRLSPRDRSYQNLIAKPGLPNQMNVSRSDPSGTLDTDRQINDDASSWAVRDGGLLAPSLDRNVWEIITIPSPQFYRARYEITFWTQYTTHMNQMIQQLMSAYLMQGGPCVRIETKQGYWFIATVEDNRYTSDDNTEDYGEEERVLRYNFNVVVPAYFIPGSTPGTPAATRRYVSAPLVSFQVGSDEVELITNSQPDQRSKLDHADDPTDPQFVLSDVHDNFTRSDVKPESTYATKVVYNPFARQQQPRYSKVVTKNPSTGETVYRDVDGPIFKIVED